ncbi:MAG: M23 family metallopeptidase [Actinobacteria bacterium]|nr:M23 family metallopeptidase [Actinomycetota bacterium]
MRRVVVVVAIAALLATSIASLPGGAPPASAGAAMGLSTRRAARPLRSWSSTTLLAVPGGADPGRAGALRYRPPVDAPVIDPFRAPTSPYGPGNRGIEYATAADTPARSIGEGTVTFAGRVAGRGVVTVAHPDGLRSSLTGLGTVVVAVGDLVEGGTVLGLTTTVVHLGVRRGDEYLDPATLFDSGGPPRHAVLVPIPRSR